MQDLQSNQYKDKVSGASLLLKAYHDKESSHIDVQSKIKENVA